jgi:hypothetical protein
MTKEAPTKLIMRRVLDTLRPINPHGLEVLCSIYHGDLVNVEIKFDRSLRQNAYYWTLISKVWDNLDHRVFPKPTNFHQSLKAMLGEFEEVWVPRGATIVDPKTGEMIVATENTRMLQVGSTSFRKMSGADFAIYLDRVIDLIIQYWMPTAKRQEIVGEVDRMLGYSLKSITGEDS